ncbi:MAG: DNA helicase UvrD, partial [bacterium]|nr:DNA helicase UvrD [bacterium]
DGHRKCGIRWDPLQTIKHGGQCPGCGKPVTVGVMNRVALLSDRKDLTRRKNRAPFFSIIPLKEIMSEIEGVGPNSKKVGRRYITLLKKGITELDLLLKTPLEEIEKMDGPELAEALRRMRDREVDVVEGFDGEYGRVTVFDKKEAGAFQSQELLFKDIEPITPRKRQPREMINFDLAEY